MIGEIQTCGVAPRGHNHNYDNGRYNRSYARNRKGKDKNFHDIPFFESKDPAKSVRQTHMFSK